MRETPAADGLARGERLTVDLAMSARPCAGNYPESRVSALLGDGLLPSEIVRLDIPAEDRWWALCVPGFLPDDALRLIAACVARSALTAERKAEREPDPRSWQAVRIAEHFAHGRATREELTAVRTAARNAAIAAEAAARNAAIAAADAAADAAEAAARCAAWDAAEAAARTAARNAAIAAADAAADAAEAAARYAAWDAAIQRYFRIAKRVLEPKGLW